MAEIRASFFIECEELLEALQDGLQTMDDGENDSETINIVFRAVHSIKGGAGAFGLESLVRFAHRYETALDEVRVGRLVADENALKLFFQAADHVADLVRISRDDGEIPDDRSKELLVQFDALIGAEDAEEAEAEEIEFQPMGLALDLGLGGGGMPDLDNLAPSAPAPVLDIDQGSASAEFDYTVIFRPFAELFETGNEPFHLLRGLHELGECKVELIFEDLPKLEDFVPEKPHMHWSIAIKTEADTAEIQSVFEFVEGLCALEVTPYSSGTSEEKKKPTPVVEAPAPSIPDTPPPVLEPATEPMQQPEDLPPQPSEPSVEAKEEKTVDTSQSPPPVKDAKPKASAPKPAAQAAKSVVRVDLDRIERLVNLVGELVINQAMLSQSLEQSGLSSHSDAMNGLEEFQRLTRDIQDSVMMIRAQPVKSLFQRMSRIVREASAAVKKDVRLNAEGENTEVDKTVIERLADPLTHMIRNAVDHGLETTEERVAAGKPKQGMVRLAASHKSGRVVIEVSDDGGGINRAKVLEIAISKGLVPEEANLSDTEIDNLLFLPGFSTAKVVSDLSGRGVGMDVVKTAIQALGGRITITSESGVGTTFSISLPLTLAVLDGMVVQVAGETLVVPLNLVMETLTLSDLYLDEIRPGVKAIRVRGDFVPLFDLGVELGYRAPLDDPSGCVVLLIAQEDGQKSALMIDDIKDQRQVVIKGLDDSFYRAPGIAAATILGDGQIALILDPTDIINQASSVRLVSENTANNGAVA
ncbi:MAG: chemotaxis protein CheA [Aliishimia sp.]